MTTTGKPHRAMDGVVRGALAEARLYGILDIGYVAECHALTVAKQLLESGVQVLQLRAKGMEHGAIKTLGRSLAAICRQYQVPFILNDYPELVAAAGADGVHVGQDDASVAEAKALSGSWCIVGKSTHSLEQARAAAGEGVDYIGFGPLFPTPTKPDYQAIGLDDIRDVHESVKIPVFCIGGIKYENLPVVLQAGAKRVVIVSGLLQALDIGGMVRDCRTLLATNPTNPVGGEMEPSE